MSLRPPVGSVQGNVASATFTELQYPLPSEGISWTVDDSAVGIADQHCVAVFEVHEKCTGLADAGPIWADGGAPDGISAAPHQPKRMQHDALDVRMQT